MMPRPSSLILLTAAALCCLLATASPSNAPSPGTTPTPTVELIREAVELSVLEADVSAIVTSRLDGYTGGVRCLLIAQGTARIGTHLDEASIERIDPGAYTLELTLTEPTVLSVRIDPVNTRAYSVDRTGLWQMLPFSTREGEVTAAAWARAEDRLRQAAERDDLIRRARERTVELIDMSIEPLGWSATVAWTPP